MSKIGQWIVEMEEVAQTLSRDEFIRRYGFGQAIVWDRVNGPEYPEDESFWDYGYEDC